MILTYRYKLMLTKSQYREMDRICEDQRQLYNAALQERRDAWRMAKVSISKRDQFKSLTQIRGFSEIYDSVPATLSRWTISRVDDAMNGFFGRVKKGLKPGFPRFRSFGRWKSFGFAEFNGFRIKDDEIRFKPFKNGLKLNLHRPIPANGSPKSCQFTKIGRHWFATIAFDVPTAQEHQSPGSFVGVDVGIEYLMVTSDGEFIANPRIGSRHSKAVRRANRALARCKRSSKRRAKVREKLARLHRRIAQCRSTYLHQVTASLTRRYETIAVEKLQVKNMTASAKGTVDDPGRQVRQKAGLNRSFLDVAPSRLIAYATYKAERAGGSVVTFKPHYTSQDCSSCGARVKKSLSQRTHRCACGTILQRDYNASLNIKRHALLACGRAMPPGDVNVRQQPKRRPGNVVCEAA